jgi:prepilin-type N-terminal cleavage/methylation domain-containing protein
MSKNGFTLVEVLIGVLIAAFLLTAVWMSFVSGSLYVDAARHSAQAADLCEAGIERMQAKTQAELLALKGTAVSEQLNLDYSEDQSTAITCIRTTTVTDLDNDNVYEITVTVIWAQRYLGGRKGRSVSMTTQIAKINI